MVVENEEFSRHVIVGDGVKNPGSVLGLTSRQREVVSASQLDSGVDEGGD